MVDGPTVRHLHRRLEPLHGFIYFAPEATGAGGGHAVENACPVSLARRSSS